MSAGNEVVIVKNGTRICGSGGVLCTAPIVQNKCYFEVKVQQSGKCDSCMHIFDLLSAIYVYKQESGELV